MPRDRGIRSFSRAPRCCFRGSALNLPNLLTLSRIGLSLLLPFLLLAPGLGTKAAALAVFVAAALTDWWDGRIARRRGLVSKFGVMMDPIADKVLVLAAFFAFAKTRVAPAWMVVLIATRELLITGLRMIALARGKTLPAEAAGKVKAAAQMVTISVTLIYLITARLLPAENVGVSYGLAAVRGMMGVTVLLTITSGASFLWHNRKQIFGS